MALSDARSQNIYFLSIKNPFLRKLLKDILQQNEGINQQRRQGYRKQWLKPKGGPNMMGGDTHDEGKSQLSLKRARHERR